MQKSKDKERILERVRFHLQEYIGGLEEVTKPDATLKINKSSILYNYIVSDHPNPVEIECFARLLFKDKDETYSEIIERL